MVNMTLKLSTNCTQANSCSEYHDVSPSTPAKQRSPQDRKHKVTGITNVNINEDWDGLQSFYLGALG